MKYLYLGICMLILNSCDILGSEDESFQCEKNAPLKLNDKDICAQAGANDYSWNSIRNEEKVNVTVTWGGGNFEIQFKTNTGKLKVGKYLYPGEVNLWIPNLNKAGSGEVNITSIDTINNVFSARFNLEAESASNFQAYPYHVEGVFNKVRY